MDFGRVTEAALGQINFALPPDPPRNKKILKGSNSNHPLIYIGCAKWGRKEWVGKLYPKGTKEQQFLEHYVRHYNSIELNATHYNIYGPEAIAKWADKAKGLDFKFCPKVTQSISHYSGFNNTDRITDAFMEGVRAFGKHLGPIFLQVSEKYSPAQREKLFEYLKKLPPDQQFFLEVRHPQWFSDTSARKELFDILTQLNVGAVITDTAGRRDCAHMELTIPKTFIRYVGNSLHPTDYIRINDWVSRIKYWLDNGLKELYFFMHMHDEALSPELTVYLTDKLNGACRLNLHKPGLNNNSGSLFD